MPVSTTTRRACSILIPRRGCGSLTDVPVLVIIGQEPAHIRIQTFLKLLSQRCAVVSLKSKFFVSHQGHCLVEVPICGQQCFQAELRVAVSMCSSKFDDISPCLHFVLSCSPVFNHFRPAFIFSYTLWNEFLNKPFSCYLSPLPFSEQTLRACDCQKAHKLEVAHNT